MVNIWNPFDVATNAVSQTSINKKVKETLTHSQVAVVLVKCHEIHRHFDKFSRGEIPQSWSQATFGVSEIPRLGRSREGPEATTLCPSLATPYHFLCWEQTEIVQRRRMWRWRVWYPRGPGETRHKRARLGHTLIAHRLQSSLIELVLFSLLSPVCRCCWSDLRVCCYSWCIAFSCYV